MGGRASGAAVPGGRVQGATKWGGGRAEQIPYTKTDFMRSTIIHFLSQINGNSTHDFL